MRNRFDRQLLELNNELIQMGGLIEQAIEMGISALIKQDVEKAKQALLNQLNTNQQQMHLKHRFQKMLDSPFFGRVDFCYDGEDAAESFYIGIGNFAERTGQTPLVYDWRAPVSGLFYDFDKGEAV